MLYPRQTDNGELVQDNQIVNSGEHLAHGFRILCLSGQIGSSMDIHNYLLALDSLSNDPIRLIINSPGGELDSTFLLYDTIRLIKSPVDIAGRYCASAAAILLASGRNRYLFPHAKVMLHLPAGQMGGDAKDWEIQHRQMIKYKSQIVDILQACGVRKSHDEILADIDRDFWMGPQEAIDYGLADKVMTNEIWAEWTNVKV